MESFASRKMKYFRASNDANVESIAATTRFSALLDPLLNAKRPSFTCFSSSLRTYRCARHYSLYFTTYP